jgi:uncharacterized membrane protein
MEPNASPISSGTSTAPARSLPPSTESNYLPAPSSETPSRWNRLSWLGRVCFSVGIAAFGVLQFIFWDIIPGRAPAWPTDLPGQVPTAVITGVAWAAIAAALWRRAYALWAAGIAITLLFGWATLRHIPAVAADVVLGGSWTQFGKSLVLIGAFGVFGAWLHPALFGRSAVLARVCLGAFLLLCGAQHFRWEPYVAALVPPWIPGGGIFWTRAAGGLLLAGGVGLFIPRFTRQAAGLSGLMIFLWIFLLHLPRAFQFHNQNEWTAVFEALAFSGLAFALTRTRSA